MLFFAWLRVDHVPRSVVSSLKVFFALVSRFRLLCKKCFRLHHHITDTFYSVVSYLFLPFSLRIFHVSVSWGFFTGVWVTVSLLRFRGHFLGFCPILIKLKSRSSRFILRFPTLHFLFPRRLLKMSQLQYVLSTLSCSAISLVPWYDLSICLLFSFFDFYLGFCWDGKIHSSVSSLF